MECRPDCGACCIYPSISSVIPGMPNGKPANIRCIHLLDNMRCNIYLSTDRPKVCAGFKAEISICGNNHEEAKAIFESLMHE